MALSSLHSIVEESLKRMRVWIVVGEKVLTTVYYVLGTTNRRKQKKSEEARG